MTALSGQEIKACGVLGLIVFLYIAASACSNQKNQGTPSIGGDNLEEVAENLASAEASAPIPLDASAVVRGGSQLRLVASLDLPGSRQIFSQNCYDALAKAFDWHQLDRCGSFDALTVRWSDQSTSLTAEELEYFQSETAAMRYLTIAISNGLAGHDADMRWASLETVANKLNLPRTAGSQEELANSNSIEAEGNDEDDSESETIDDPLAPAAGTSL